MEEDKKQEESEEKQESLDCTQDINQWKEEVAE